MPSLPHDASRDSLFTPGAATDFFTWGILPDEAALCAEMARVAYVKEEERLRDYLAAARYADISGFDLHLTCGYQSGGMQAFVAGAQGVAVVAFRGTETDDPSDLFTDLNFPLTDWAPKGAQQGRVHEGFAGSLSEAFYHSLIAAIPAGTHRVLFTGHSLGAALATLAASRYAQPGALYTFGSPRVGDATFARSLSHVEHARFADCCDMVTRVPPEEFGYQHTGTLHYINRDGQVSISPPEEQIEIDRQTASRTYLFSHAFQHGTVPVRELADHTPMNYVSAAAGWRS